MRITLGNDHRGLGLKGHVRHSLHSVHRMRQSGRSSELLGRAVG